MSTTRPCSRTVIAAARVTVRGQWLSPRADNDAMIRLIASGVLDLGPETVTTFGLDDVNDAVAFAADHGGAFDRTVLTPG